MATTISGHPAHTPGSFRLRTATVPGSEVRLTTNRVALPLFLDLARRLNVRVQKLSTRDCWSYAYRPPRMGSGYSDHAGWAIDLWSSGIGAHTWPSRMPADKAKVISRILERYKTADGRHVFGWGIDSVHSPGVDYTGPTYHATQYNDPMHFFIAPGISFADLKAVREAKGIKRDGTRR